MKNYCIGVISVISSVLCACTSGSKHLVESDGLKYDSVCIDIDYPYLSQYVSCTSCVKDGNLYMVAYNHLTHAFDFIDMSGNGNHCAVSLQREGNNGVAASDVIYCTASGIVVKELSGIKLVGYDGKVIMNIPMSEITDATNGNRYSLCNIGVMPGGYDNIAYDSLSHSVFVPLVPLDATRLGEVSLGGRVSLKDEEYVFLPVSYPYPYSEIAKNMGSYFLPHFSVADGQRLIYNFYGSSKFWIYHTDTGATVEMDMPSMCTDNVAAFPEGSDSRQIFEQETMSLRFREIHYIPSLHYFVRVHYAPRKTLFDKDINRFLMVMREDDGCIHEFLLPPSFDGRYFVSGTDIYFFISGSDMDDKIRLGKVDLSGINIDV